jgi:hypothetical protein
VVFVDGHGGLWRPLATLQPFGELGAVAIGRALSGDAVRRNRERIPDHREFAMDFFRINEVSVASRML